jgi:hypothetical protein
VVGEPGVEDLGDARHPGRPGTQVGAGHAHGMAPVT